MSSVSYFYRPLNYSYISLVVENDVTLIELYGASFMHKMIKLHEDVTSEGQFIFWGSVTWLIEFH